MKRILMALARPRLYRAPPALPSKAPEHTCSAEECHMSQADFALLDARGVLEIAGDDRHEFLQGLISNDTRKLTPTRALYAAFLTPQGKYLHDFFLVEIGASILLEGERARLGDLLRRLSIYKLRAKVTLADASERFIAAAAFGAEALARLGL